MKTTLNDLNEYLFEQLDRLTNEDLNDEQLEKEVKRAESVQKIARTIIDNGHLALSAQRFKEETGSDKSIFLIEGK